MNTLSRANNTNNYSTINYWIKQAANFNNQWKDTENKYQVLQQKENISSLEQCKLEFYQQQIKLLTQQKDNCQIMALRLAYYQATTSTVSYRNPLAILNLLKLAHHQTTPILIEIDPNEAGEVYSLESKDLDGKYRCHIPKQKLIQYLTNEELQFFQII